MCSPMRAHADYLRATPTFRIADFPAMFAAAAFGAHQATLRRFNAKDLCEAIERERINYTACLRN
jgi:hypothetical protein